MGGGSGGRDEAMRLALQKKRWIEMQLHEVQLRSFSSSSVGFHLEPHVLPVYSTQDIRNVPAADRKRRDQGNARLCSAARCRYASPAISFDQSRADVHQNPKLKLVCICVCPAAVTCSASHAIFSSSCLGHRLAPSRQSLRQGTIHALHQTRLTHSRAFFYRT